MKRGQTAGILLAVFTIIVVIIFAGSFALSALRPQMPTATATATVAATVTGTPDPCDQQHITETVNQFDLLSRQFNDAFTLAQNTPAQDLSASISELQRIRRLAQDYPVPSCLATLKRDQLAFMDTAINTSLALFSNATLLNSVSACVGKPNCVSQAQATQAVQVVALVNQGMTTARQYASEYTLETARLLGVTLTPSPTTIPATMPPLDVTPGP